MTVVKKGGGICALSMASSSSFTKNRLGSPQLCYRGVKTETTAEKTWLQWDSYGDVATAATLMGERRSFIISRSSCLPPLVILQLLTSWWPKIDNSKLATLWSP